MSIILDILFPKKCVSCRVSGGYFCQDCVYKIMQKNLICPECEKASIGGKTHSFCKTKYSLDGLWSLGAYQGTLELGIKALKYRLIPELADILVSITLDYWQRHEPFFLDEIQKDHWVVSAVPLHWYRKNKRGYNQAELVAKKLGLKYIESLKRTKYTKSQVSLESNQRRENIKDAFAINCKLLPETCLLLVDDVWTTGSTLRECCKVLKQNGAKKVWALTLAR